MTAPCIPKKNKSFVQPVPVVWMVRPAWPLCEQESDSTLSAAVAVAASPSKAKDGRREGGGDCDTAATFARACRVESWMDEFHTGDSTNYLEILLMCA